MSIRSSLISFVLRHTVKKQMASFDDPVAMRERMAGQARNAPAEVRVEPVDAGGVPAEWVAWPDVADDAALLYLHGGGYVFGGPDSHRDLAWRLSRSSGLPVLVIDYRLAPEDRFPAALEDALAAYDWLLGQGIDPARLAVAGDSAGGGLAAATLVAARDAGLALPAAAVLMSPWADCAMTGASMNANAASDAMLSPEAISRFAGHYLGDADPRDPRASPIFADLSGLPPVHVLVGDTEVLLSDSETLVERLRDAGVEATIEIWPNMPHVFPVLGGMIPEAPRAIADMGAFLGRHCGTATAV